MKLSTLAALLVLLFSASFAQGNPEASKSIFQQAKAHLENMLTGKETSSYEQAVFTIENAWYENKINRVSIDRIIDHQIDVIKIIYNANYHFNQQQTKATLEFSKADLEEKYKKALLNWSIYSYISQNVEFVNGDKTYYHPSFHYSTSDPMASDDWTNSQVISLISRKRGNCFALASLFKILSDRLNSEATLCTAPSHIYISHKDNLGTPYNIELGSKNFPGTGLISAVTYTTDQAIRNNISQRELNKQQSIALCLVYLAKGYEHKFNNTTDPFILECAETAIKYDDHNLNALLLKAEYLENKLISKQKTVTELQKQKDFIEYQSLIANLYNLGYREMPLDMKNTLIKLYNNERVVTKLTNQVEERKATLSWGLFDERHSIKQIERISNTLFNTTTNKITSFAKEQSLYNNYNFDPVVFAWNVDPMAHKREWVSPYSFVQNNPINRVDKSGALDDIVINGDKNSSVIVKTDAIDISVDVSCLGIGFGGNYTLDGDDILQASLDIVGIVDPTGVADAVNAGISAEKGNWGDAIISGLGVIPYLGDLAKVGKVEKDVKVIEHAVEDLAKVEKKEAAISKKYSKKEARETAKAKRSKQPASEEYVKDYKAKKIEKERGKDARREAHDKKEKGDPNRSKKQIDEDYK